MRSPLVHSAAFRSRLRRVPILALAALGLSAAPAAMRAAVDDTLAARPSIDVAVRRAGDSVVLRWTPSDPATWRAGLAYGYRIVRTGGIPGGHVVTAWTEATWRERARSGNALAGTATAILFDTAETAGASAQGDGALELEGTLEDARYGTAMLMAASDAIIAEGLALRFVDRTAGQAGLYTYCVSVNAPAPVTARGCVSLGATRAMAMGAPDSLVAATTDGTVQLSWSAAKNRDLLGFYVDRVDEETGEILRLTQGPILVPELPDSIDRHVGTLRDASARADRRYRYEVRSIDGFGELSAPAVASVQQAAPLERLPSPPELRLRQRGECALELAWETPPAVDRTLCLRVERSRTLFGDYETIETVCGAERSSIVDASASRKYPYYRIVVVGDGQELASEGVHATFVDSVPPAPPVGLRGSIDSAGVVSLHWSAGRECDVRGYHVFWSNDPTHELVPRTRGLCEDTTFSDTINIETLTRRAYYRVAAVDFTGLASSYSTLLELERPDRLRPLPPVLIEAAAVEGGVVLRWAPSPSADVEKQYLLRSGGADEPPVLIATLDAGATGHRDETVAPAKEYAYQLFVEDSSANRSSMAGPLRVSVPRSKETVAVTRLEGALDPAARAVRLTWDVSAEPGADAWFVVLRSGPGRGLEAIGTARSHERAYVDGDLREPGEYTYALQIARGQSRSVISTRVTVVVP